MYICDLDPSMYCDVKTIREYIDEGLNLVQEMRKNLDKSDSDLTDEEKKLFTRASEIYLLIEVLKALSER